MKQLRVNDLRVRVKFGSNTFITGVKIINIGCENFESAERKGRCRDQYLARALDHQLVIRCSYHLTRSLFVHRRGPTPPQRTAEILRRKPTRIELKPDDREEYFAQKNKGKQPEQADSKDAKQPEKDTRIGIVRPR